ncbi:MAG: heme exporter protein CcmB [Chloroflexota bacterium]
MTTPFFKTVFAILFKDLRAETRSRELVSAMGLFTLLSILAFSFALELNRDAEQEVVAGVLWVTLIFASILGLNRSLAQEREQGNLDAMMIAPVSRIAVYLGKAMGNLLFTFLVGVFLLPLMTILFDMPLLNVEMLAVLFLGLAGLAAIGTLLATMTVQTRARETLLPIAMLPVALPIILTVVRGTNGMLNDGDISLALGTLLVVDIIYLTLGSLLFEYVTED